MRISDWSSDVCSSDLLLQHLEAVDARREAGTGGFRLPVQWVCRLDQNFRGFSGPVVGGPVAVGDEIAVLPSGQRSRVATIVTADGHLERAVEGQAVTLAHADEIEARRGDSRGRAACRARGRKNG